MKKRILSMVLAIVMCISLLPVSVIPIQAAEGSAASIPADAFSAGNGSFDSPYAITSSSQIKYLDAKYGSYWFELKNNIQMGNQQSGVGDFTGHLEGRGYTISGLHGPLVKTVRPGAELLNFTLADNYRIDLHIEGGYRVDPFKPCAEYEFYRSEWQGSLVNRTTVDDFQLGCAAGVNEGLINNVTVRNALIRLPEQRLLTDDGQREYAITGGVGFLCGHNLGDIANSTVIGATVQIEWDLMSIGGLVGINEGNIYNSIVHDFTVRGPHDKVPVTNVNSEEAHAYIELTGVLVGLQEGEIYNSLSPTAQYQQNSGPKQPYTPVTDPPNSQNEGRVLSPVGMITNTYTRIRDVQYGANRLYNNRISRDAYSDDRIDRNTKDNTQIGTAYGSAVDFDLSVLNANAEKANQEDAAHERSFTWLTRTSASGYPTTGYTSPLDADLYSVTELSDGLNAIRQTYVPKGSTYTRELMNHRDRYFQDEWDVLADGTEQYLATIRATADTPASCTVNQSIRLKYKPEYQAYLYPHPGVHVGSVYNDGLWWSMGRQYNYELLYDRWNKDSHYEKIPNRIDNNPEHPVAKYFDQVTLSSDAGADGGSYWFTYQKQNAEGTEKVGSEVTSIPKGDYGRYQVLVHTRPGWDLDYIFSQAEWDSRKCEMWYFGPVTGEQLTIRNHVAGYTGQPVEADIPELDGLTGITVKYQLQGSDAQLTADAPTDSGIYNLYVTSPEHIYKHGNSGETYEYKDCWQASTDAFVGTMEITRSGLYISVDGIPQTDGFYATPDGCATKIPLTGGVIPMARLDTDTRYDLYRVQQKYDSQDLKIWSFTPGTQNVIYYNLVELTVHAATDGPEYQIPERFTTYHSLGETGKWNDEYARRYLVPDNAPLSQLLTGTPEVHTYRGSNELQAFDGWYSDDGVKIDPARETAASVNRSIHARYQAPADPEGLVKGRTYYFYDVNTYGDPAFTGHATEGIYEGYGNLLDGQRMIPMIYAGGYRKDTFYKTMGHEQENGSEYPMRSTSTYDYHFIGAETYQKPSAFFYQEGINDYYFWRKHSVDIIQKEWNPLWDSFIVGEELNDVVTVVLPTRGVDHYSLKNNQNNGITVPWNDIDQMTWLLGSAMPEVVVGGEGCRDLYLEGTNEKKPHDNEIPRYVKRMPDGSIEMPRVKFLHDAKMHTISPEPSDLVSVRLSGAMSPEQAANSVAVTVNLGASAGTALDGSTLYLILPVKDGFYSLPSLAELGDLVSPTLHPALWAGNDGKSYPIGAKIPAAVTTLTASAGSAVILDEAACLNAGLDPKVYSGYYAIRNENDFSTFAHLSKEQAVKAVQLADFTFSNGTETRLSELNGVYDGNGHTIFGAPTGLFDTVAATGVVRNVTFDKIAYQSIQLDYYHTIRAGALVNTLRGTLENVQVKNPIDHLVALAGGNAVLKDVHVWDLDWHDDDLASRPIPSSPSSPKYDLIGRGYVGALVTDLEPNTNLTVTDCSATGNMVSSRYGRSGMIRSAGGTNANVTMVRCWSRFEMGYNPSDDAELILRDGTLSTYKYNSDSNGYDPVFTYTNTTATLEDCLSEGIAYMDRRTGSAPFITSAKRCASVGYGPNGENCYSLISDSGRLPLGVERAYLMDTNNDTVEPRNFWGTKKDGTIGLRSNPECLPSFKVTWHDEAGSCPDTTLYMRDGTLLTLANRPAGWDVPDMSSRLLVTDRGETVSLGNTVIKASTDITWKMAGADQTLAHIFYEFEPDKFKHYTTQSGQPLNTLPHPYIGMRMLDRDTQQEFIPGVTKAPAAPGSLVLVQDRAEGLTRTPEPSVTAILQGNGSVHITGLAADTWYLITTGSDEGDSVLLSFQSAADGSYDWALAASKEDAERLRDANTYYLIAIKSGQTVSNAVKLYIQYKDDSAGYLNSKRFPFGSVLKVSDLENELGLTIPREKLTDSGHYLYNAQDDTLTIHQMESFKIYVNAPESENAYAGLGYINCYVDKVALELNLDTPIQRTYTRYGKFVLPTRDELKELFADQGLVINGVRVPPSVEEIDQTSENYIYVELGPGGEYSTNPKNLAAALDGLPKDTTHVELKYRVRISTKDPFYKRDGEGWMYGTMQVELQDVERQVDLSGLTIKAHPVENEPDTYEITYGEFENWTDVIQMDPSRCSITENGQKLEGTFSGIDFAGYPVVNRDYYNNVTHYTLNVKFKPAGGKEVTLKSVKIWVHPKPLEVIWDHAADTTTFGVEPYRPTATLKGILPRDQGKKLEIGYKIDLDGSSFNDADERDTPQYPGTNYIWAYLSRDVYTDIEEQAMNNYSIARDETYRKTFVVNPLDMAKAINIRLTDVNGKPMDSIKYTGKEIDISGWKFKLHGTYDGKDFAFSNAGYDPFYGFYIDSSNSVTRATEPGTYTLKLQGDRVLKYNGELYSGEFSWTILDPVDPAMVLKPPVLAEGTALNSFQCTLQGSNNFKVSLWQGSISKDSSQSSLGKLQYRLLTDTTRLSSGTVPLTDWQDTMPTITEKMLLENAIDYSDHMNFILEVRVTATNSSYKDSPSVRLKGIVNKIGANVWYERNATIVGSTELTYDGTVQIPPITLTLRGEIVPKKYYETVIRNDVKPILPGTYAVLAKMNRSIFNCSSDDQLVHAGDFTIVSKDKGSMNASILNPKPGNIYTYGDSITVEATPAASGDSQVSLSAVPEPGRMKLFYVDSNGNETELAKGTTSPGERCVLSYHTTGNKLPVGTDLTLRVRYGGFIGSDNSYLSDSFYDFVITLNKASITLPEGLTAETRTYKADSMKIRVPESNIAALGGKTLNFGGIVTIEDNTVGEKTTNVPLGQLMSNYGDIAPWYNLPEALPVAYSILPAQSYVDSVSTNSPLIYNTYDLYVQFMPQQMLPPGEVALQSVSDLPLNTAVLYTSDGTELARTNTEDGKTVTLYVKTTDKQLSIGKHTLTVRYGGSSNSSPCEFTVEVEILPKELELETFRVDQRTYRAGDVSAPAHPEKVTLYGAFSDDDVTVNYSGVSNFRYDSDLVSDVEKPVHYDGNFALAGADAAYYRLKDAHPDRFAGKIVGNPQTLSCKKALTVVRGCTLPAQTLKDNILGATQSLHFTCLNTEYGNFNEDGSFTATDQLGTVNVTAKAEARSVNNDVYMEYLESNLLTFTIEVVDKYRDTTTMKVSQEGAVFAEDLTDYVLTNAPAEDTVVNTRVRYKYASGSEDWTPPVNVGVHTITVTKETADTIYTASDTFEIVNAKITGFIEQKGTLLWNGGYDCRAEVNQALDAHGYGTTVRYGRTQDKCDLYEVPTFTDVGTHTVYYTVTAYSHNPITGQFTVTIENWGAVADYSASSLTVRLTEDLPAKAWRMFAAGYDSSGRMVAIAACLLPDNPAGRSITLNCHGFDKASTVCLFLMNQKGEPITYKAESHF